MHGTAGAWDADAAYHPSSQRQPHRLPWTAVFDATYLVNLARRGDRLRATHAILAKSGVPATAYHVFNATDARELDASQWTSKSGSIVRLPSWPSKGGRKLHAGMPYPFEEWWHQGSRKDPGSVGAFLTYVRLLELVLQTEHRTVLILEDDLRLESSFHSRLAGAMALLPEGSWDALYLGYNDALFNNSGNLFPPANCEPGASALPLLSATPWAQNERCVPLCKATGTVLDMVAFAVHRRIVPSLLTYLRQQMDGKRMVPIDVALALFMQRDRVKVYVTRPSPIVVQRNRFSDSDSTMWGGWARPMQPRSSFANASSSH